MVPLKTKKTPGLDAAQLEADIRRPWSALQGSREPVGIGWRIIVGNGGRSVGRATARRDAWLVVVDVCRTEVAC